VEQIPQQVVLEQPDKEMREAAALVPPLITAMVAGAALVLLEQMAHPQWQVMVVLAFVLQLLA
jgi:hypothetical protein